MLCSISGEDYTIKNGFDKAKAKFLNININSTFQLTIIDIKSISVIFYGI